MQKAVPGQWDPDPFVVCWSIKQMVPSEKYVLRHGSDKRKTRFKGAFYTNSRLKTRSPMLCFLG